MGERLRRGSGIPQLGDSLSTELRDLRACAVAIPSLLGTIGSGKFDSDAIAAGVWRKAPVMEGHLGERLAVSHLGTTQSREWMHRLVTILEAALGQLRDQLHPAQGMLVEAASLLRQQIDPPASREVPDGRGRLLAWQATASRNGTLVGTWAVSRAIVRAPGLGERLTPREVSILKRLESGLSNREIAEAIFVSEGTLKWHLHNVYGKLNVKNRSGAMARARTLGIV
jgi:ATP/maltotriose-dependent transcriptional regulator MalT